VIRPFVREDDRVSELMNVAREVLPIPDRAYDGPVYEDAKDPAAKFAPIEPLRPPAGAPNVVVVLVDDAGSGCAGAFGGPCHTPTAERLAANGLKFPRFHTTALCSPTRATAAGSERAATSLSTSTPPGPARGRVEGTVPMLYSADETCDVGSDSASPVSDDYTAEASRFTGSAEWVQIDIADAAEDLDHLVCTEERLKIAMARQ
jgi:Sulfatase